MTDGRLRRGMLAPVLWLGLAAAGAGAQDLQASAAEITALLGQGQRLEAVAAARAFMHQVTGLAGFGVTNARLTSAPAEGFGMFTPRPDNVFRVGEPIYAYVEVYGFSMSQVSNGANRLLFDVSFTLDGPDGQQMTDAMIPMGDVRLDSFSLPLDGFFHLTYRVTGASGAYDLRTLVVDHDTGARAEFTLPVVFVESDAAGK